MQQTPLWDNKATRLGKEEVFKFEKPKHLMTTATLFCLVTNKDGTWVGKMQMSQALNEVFAGADHFFVRAMPQASGQLHIMEFLEEQGW